MAYRRPKPKVGYSSDVFWYAPDYKRRIATSTKACSDTIALMVCSGYDTPNKIVKAIENRVFIGGCEERLIIDEYIKKGFGDLVLNVK